MRYFVLIYYVGDGFVTKRAAFRDTHLARVREAHARGQLLLGGAMGEPVDRAMLLFRAHDRSTAEQFARADPYVTAGLVERWEVQPWAVVVGLQPGDFDPLAA
jgi:uncharacterized protein YciI